MTKLWKKCTSPRLHTKDEHFFSRELIQLETGGQIDIEIFG
jgi:hypothetical protein